MMRSLWTGASGMTAQQLNMDTIGNNIANVNTNGYKKERIEFQTMLYQTMKKANVSADSGLTTPLNLQVGHGVKAVATSRIFDKGSLQSTENTLDFALDGPGFFGVQVGDEVQYTKAGTFQLTPNGDDLVMVTPDGYPILSAEGEMIVLEGSSDFSVDQEGNFWQQIGGTSVEMGIQFGVYQFTNSQGLEASGGSYYKSTVASGAPLLETENDLEEYTSVSQGFLEASNVNIANEMVNMIVAQRAYELNSKTITTSDEMLQQANNLKR